MGARQESDGSCGPLFRSGFPEVLRANSLQERIPTNFLPTNFLLSCFFLVLFSLTFVSTSDISGSIHTIFGYQGIVALQDLGTPIRV
jgi:hypothetical protein